jgi:molybdopterin synthase sulfur carrier subunit
MIVKVRGILLQYVDYQSEVEVDAPTVREGLDELVERYPGLRDVLTDRDGSIRRTHLVALNGETVRGDQMDQETGEEDRLDIVTAVSGG